MKFLKYLKYAIAIWLLLTLLICVGGIIKYHIELNSYMDQPVAEASISQHNIAPETTEVYVVGSVHFETGNFKRDDLYRYLDSISPDIILYEGATKSVQRMLNKTDIFQQLMNSFKKGNKVESFVVHKYLEHHPGSQVLAFEWEEREAFHWKHNYISKFGDMTGAVLRLYRENLLNDEQTLTIKEFLEVNNELNAVGRSGSITAINNTSTDSLIKRRQSYSYKSIPEIVMERNDLGEFQDFAPVHMEYWDIRNQAMVANILKQIKEHPGKRIVVLTGFYHRYYLMDELKKFEDEFNFSVK